MSERYKKGTKVIYQGQESYITHITADGYVVKLVESGKEYYIDRENIHSKNS